MTALADYTYTIWQASKLNSTIIYWISTVPFDYARYWLDDEGMASFPSGASSSIRQTIMVVNNNFTQAQKCICAISSHPLPNWDIWGINLAPCQTKIGCFFFPFFLHQTFSCSVWNLVLDQGSDLGPLHRECGVLATGLPRKSVPQC